MAYVNIEEFGNTPGHAQLARVPVGGGPMEQLVTSDTVDWFPHLSPNGRFATYISFPTGTLGHPADIDVEVRLVRTTNRADPIARYPLFGGQGTITSTAGLTTVADSASWLPIRPAQDDAVSVRTNRK